MDDEGSERIGCEPECARPRAQQRPKSCTRRISPAHQPFQLAAPEDGRTPGIKTAPLTTTLPARPQAIPHSRQQMVSRIHFTG